MTIEQTVEIPADHRVFFEFLAPKEIPAGKARIELKVTPVVASEETEKSRIAELKKKLQNLQGSLGKNAFSGLDGVAYQRKVRIEWDET